MGRLSQVMMWAGVGCVVMLNLWVGMQISSRHGSGSSSSGSSSSGSSGSGSSGSSGELGTVHTPFRLVLAPRASGASSAIPTRDEVAAAVAAARRDIPIVVVHRDRPAELLQLLGSLGSATGGIGYTVVIHDMGSTLPAGQALIECLTQGQQGARSERCDELADRLCEHRGSSCAGQSGRRLLAAARLGGRAGVVWDSRVDDELADAIEGGRVDAPGARASFVLDRVAGTVAEAVEQTGSDVYVVTDPDVAFEAGTPSNVLDVLRAFLHALPEAEATVVAPALRVDAGPGSFRALYVRAHEAQFWAEAPVSLVVDELRVYASFPVLCDTTFGMYRAGFAFSRLNGGARVHAPYWMRHSGWHAPLRRQDWTPEARWYVDHALPMTEWSKFKGEEEPDEVFHGYVRDLGLVD